MATGNTATSNFYFEKRPWGELMDSMARVMPAIDNSPATMVAGDASAGAWLNAARGGRGEATCGGASHGPHSPQQSCCRVDDRMESYRRSGDALMIGGGGGRHLHLHVDACGARAPGVRHDHGVLLEDVSGAVLD